MSKLELYNIYVGYEESKPVLKDISFFVEKGEFIVLLGTSGCGKTTILKLIAGMIPISAGELYIDGVKSNDTPPRKRNIAMVFQNYALYPTMTAYENIAFPLQNAHSKKKDIDSSVKSIAVELGIDDLLERKPAEMSGGQQQRVAIVHRSKLSELFFTVTVLSMYIPASSLLLPTFLIFKNLSLLNTYFALILSSLNTPFLVFLFRQNIKKFPFDIIKAARLDGASDVRIFFRLCIPYLKPVFISAFIITFFESWNSILIPVVIIQSSEKFTNSIYLNSIGSIWFSDYGVLMASLLISTLPTLISFLIFRHYIKRGIYYHDK